MVNHTKKIYKWLITKTYIFQKLLFLFATFFKSIGSFINLLYFKLCHGSRRGMGSIIGYKETGDVMFERELHLSSMLITPFKLFLYLFLFKLMWEIGDSRDLLSYAIVYLNFLAMFCFQISNFSRWVVIFVDKISLYNKLLIRYSCTIMVFLW